MSKLFAAYSQNAEILLETGKRINVFYFPGLIILGICGFSLLMSVFLKFADRKSSPLKHIGCPVATFSMTVFFFALIPLISRNIGSFRVSFGANVIFFITGVLTAVSSTAFNIYARIFIKDQWSNQIEIREKHQLLRGGPYSIMRHPMYGTLILFGFGIGAMFVNYWIVILTLGIFVPMMIFRARAEEAELSERFPKQHKEYTHKTPMLLPRLGKKASLILRGIGMGFLLYIIILNRFPLDQILAVGLYHFLLSFIIDRPDVGMSFKIKPFMLLLIYGLSAKLPYFKYGYYVILGFLIMGLKFNCPGMKLYHILHNRKD